MRLISVLTICLFMIGWPAMASADTVILTNGYEIYGQASAHPVFQETHTIVKFSNGGQVTLKNSQIEQTLPNTKDHFEIRRNKGAEG